MTDCDQSTGLKASSRPAATPPAQQNRRSVRSPSSSSKRGTLRSRSAVDRLTSSASTPQATAPANAEKNATPQAGFG